MIETVTIDRRSSRQACLSTAIYQPSRISAASRSRGRDPEAEVDGFSLDHSRVAYLRYLRREAIVLGDRGPARQAQRSREIFSGWANLSE